VTRAQIRPGAFLEPGDDEPWELIEDLHHRGDLIWDDETQAWYATSAELCKAMGRRDDLLWQSGLIPNLDRDVPAGLDLATYVELMGGGSRKTITFLEGEEHDRLHRFMRAQYSPKVLERWRPEIIRPIVRQRIDAFAARGRAELVHDLATQVPPRVVATLMALPTDDVWIDRCLGLVAASTDFKQRQASRPSAEVVQRALTAARELKQLLMPFVLDRRKGTGDDFISRLWSCAPQIFEPPWDEHAIYGNVKAQFEGGQSTTTHAAANLCYLLLTTSVREEVRAGDPKVSANLVEEALRLYGGVAFRPRYAKEDVMLAGEQVRAGDLVVTLNLAAGRDPDRYPCPASVDLHRQAPGDHLAFHVGPRACAGQALARAQLGEILHAMVERLHDLRLDPDADPPVYHGGFHRGWAPLHVLFDPA